MTIGSSISVIVVLEYNSHSRAFVSSPAYFPLYWAQYVQKPFLFAIDDDDVVSINPWTSCVDHELCTLFRFHPTNTFFSADQLTFSLHTFCLSETQVLYKGVPTQRVNEYKPGMPMLPHWSKDSVTP